MNDQLLTAQRSLKRGQFAPVAAPAQVEPGHLPCPMCKTPVRVIARADQPHRHFADHGKVLGVLCAGSGKSVSQLP